MHIITCAHVVNAALGRDPRAQEPPGPQARVQVDFPMLDGPAGARSRSCAVQAWVPPPSRGLTGGDVAGLVLADKGLPEHASPAGLADPMVWDVTASVFGYPGDPPRPAEGAWAEVKLRGMNDNRGIQLDGGSESVIRLQPGYSGSPVVMTSGAGADTVLGMLAVASTDRVRGTCAIPVSELARAWPDVIDAGQVKASPGVRNRGRKIAQRYQLQAPVGRGAMGVVWRAHDLLLDRDVAVKEVVISALIGADERRNAYRRTLREARTAARLDHRAIVSIYDVCEDESRPWIVMQLVDAPSLDQVLASSGPLSLRKTAEVGLQLLSALSMAHAAGVLHRDVKPSNVLLGRDDRVVLTDFGIAAFQGDPRITKDGMVMGSPGFTAPERIRGGEATPASDLWSLGATLFTAAEGHGPYEGRGDVITTMSAIINEEAPEAPAAGPLAPVIVSLLRRNPAERPGAAEATRLITNVFPPGHDPVQAGGDAAAVASPAEGARPACQGHAFISYVREDSTEVATLQRALEDAGIPVWRDKSSLWPGENWRVKIRDAITHDALVFIACFSASSVARQKTYQYEELLLAIDQLRMRRPDDPWLVPVRFDDCEVPDFELGGGRTLTSIQRADLFGARSDLETARLVEAVKRLLR